MLHRTRGAPLLQTLRSHDQWNTIPYATTTATAASTTAAASSWSTPTTWSALGLADRSQVDLVSVWRDGAERRAENFQVVAYPTTPGSAAAYYPETNVLVPLDSVADISNTPTSKSITIRLEPTHP